MRFGVEGHVRAVGWVRTVATTLNFPGSGSLMTVTVPSPPLAL